ncbi:MAG: heme NO-binding domain-containing protein [Cyclobacteriaceae bacterium]|nr:heme NO-binding domain-containing protein [Cyclobacteriaceae bacterium HetDA_MAG_MS6]
MKGIVFTEFLQFIENHHGYEIVDEVIQQSSLSTGGAYTAVGSYPFEELVSLLTKTSTLTSTTASDLLRSFGHHLFQTFLSAYPQFFEGITSSFQILSTLESKIHPEVRKLYPDAELPKFDVEEMNQASMTLLYQSSRKMSDLALGLIEACLQHFGEDGDIAIQLQDDEGEIVRFIINRGA